MAENTSIEWCRHTFNAWTGCAKVSCGCRRCYAAAWAGRFPGRYGRWGTAGSRVVASESTWQKPLVWDRKAAAAGERHRVFASSMADVFEGEDTMPPEAVGPVRDARRRLAAVIAATMNLDWLLLTKRPENAPRMLADMFGPDRAAWPANFRVGASVEDQPTADERLPHLLRLDWPNFVSYEPALGPIDFRRVVERLGVATHVVHDALRRKDGLNKGTPWRGIDWLIMGGESGHGAQPMHPAWPRLARDQCRIAGVPFLFKQWGEWAPWPGFDPAGKGQLIQAVFHDGADLPDLTGRGTNGTGAARMARVGRKVAGRLLDGAIHDEFPEPAGVAA